MRRGLGCCGELAIQWSSRVGRGRGWPAFGRLGGWPGMRRRAGRVRRAAALQLTVERPTRQLLACWPSSGQLTERRRLVTIGRSAGQAAFVSTVERSAGRPEWPCWPLGGRHDEILLSGRHWLAAQRAILGERSLCQPLNGQLVAGESACRPLSGRLPGDRSGGLAGRLGGRVCVGRWVVGSWLSLGVSAVERSAGWPGLAAGGQWLVDSGAWGVLAVGWSAVGGQPGDRWLRGLMMGCAAWDGRCVDR